jgi:hypothetical protein
VELNKMKREETHPSDAQLQSRADKEAGLKPTNAADTMSQREFEALGKGQTLDQLRDSAESKSENQRRKRNEDEVGREWVDPRGKYEGADDSEPESGEFDPAEGNREQLSKRDEKAVSDQKRRDYNFHQSQMLSTEPGGQLNNPSAPPASVDSNPEARSEEVQARAAKV